MLYYYIQFVIFSIFFINENFKDKKSIHKIIIITIPLVIIFARLDLDFIMQFIGCKLFTEYWQV